MTLFVALVFLMLAAALAFVLWPLLAKSEAQGAERDRLNVALYKDRLAELESERTDGSLSDTEFAQALKELQRDLLVNVDPESESESRGRVEGGRWLPWLVGLAVPVAALAVYLPLGSLELIGAKVNTAPQQTDSGMPEIEQAIAQLRQRLERKPDNLNDWQVLGRTLNSMGRHGKAADVYAQAMGALGEKTELLLGRAQALALAEGNRLSGEPIQLVRRVLSREPEQLEALWLSGLHAFEQGKYQQAVESWQRVKAQVAEGGELSGTVDSAIAEARAHLNNDSAADMMDSRSEPAAGAGAGLSVEVTIAPELARHLQPDDTLFIFARVPGSRMPVMAERRQVTDLPLNIVFTDDGSMVDQPLSAFEQLEVVARVSKSGSTAANTGDLEGSRITVSGKSVIVTIDQIVP